MSASAGPGGRDGGAHGPLRVVLAEDSVLLREGIARLLQEAGMEVVGGCETAPELLRLVGDLGPDVAVVDIRLPPTHRDEGLQAAQAIRARHPRTGVLVLSQYVELDLAMDLVADSAEGAGYLLKDRVADLEEFAAAVRRVGSGGTAIDSSIVAQLLGRRRGEDPLAALTARDRAVLELMAQGCSNQAIAARTGITLRAAEKQVSAVFDKLGLPSTGGEHRRVLAVLRFLSAG